MGEKAPCARALAVSKKTRGGHIAAQPKRIHEKATREEQAAEARAALAAGRARTLEEKRDNTEPLEPWAACGEQAATRTPSALLVLLSLGAALGESTPYTEAGLEVLTWRDPLADGTTPRHLNDEVPPYRRHNYGFPVAGEHTAQQLFRNSSCMNQRAMECIYAFVLAERSAIRVNFTVARRLTRINRRKVTAIVVRPQSCVSCHPRCRRCITLSSA